MANDVIPDSNHISRYCKPSTVIDEKPLPTAFQLRKGEDHLSVDWLELLEKISGNCDSAAITNALNNRRLKVKKRGRYALFNVGELVGYIKDKSPDNRELKALHDSSKPTNSHSGIYNFTHEENNMFGVLISQAIKEILKTQ
jgi:hypothetical protein